MKICPMCNINSATKTNCHIFPSFFGDTMKKLKKITRVYKLNEANILGHKSFKQDTAKEDYLLCPSCESFLGNDLESHVADCFYNLRYDKNSYFKTRINKGLFYKTFYNLDYLKFKRLAYSMLFRASIASVFPFTDFMLNDINLEKRLADVILGKCDFEDISMVKLDYQN